MLQKSNPSIYSVSNYLDLVKHSTTADHCGDLIEKWSRAPQGSQAAWKTFHYPQLELGTSSCPGICSWELLGQEMVPPWVLAEQVGDHKCKGNYLPLPSSLHLYISSTPSHRPVLTPIPSQHHFLPSYSQLRPRKLHSRPPTCPLASDDTQSPWHHLTPRKE